MRIAPNQPLQLTRPASQSFEKSCSLRPAPQVNAIVRHFHSCCCPINPYGRVEKGTFAFS